MPRSAAGGGCVANVCVATDANETKSAESAILDCWPRELVFAEDRTDNPVLTGVPIHGQCSRGLRSQDGRQPRALLLIVTLLAGFIVGLLAISHRIGKPDQKHKEEDQVASPKKVNRQNQ